RPSNGGSPSRRTPSRARATRGSRHPAHALALQGTGRALTTSSRISIGGIAGSYRDDRLPVESRCAGHARSPRSRHNVAIGLGGGARMKYKDYYSILGVAKDANTNSIKTAYRKL